MRTSEDTPMFVRPGRSITGSAAVRERRPAANEEKLLRDPGAAPVSHLPLKW
jgi:hypothetical protein